MNTLHVAASASLLILTGCSQPTITASQAGSSSASGQKFDLVCDGQATVGDTTKPVTQTFSVDLDRMVLTFDHKRELTAIKSVDGAEMVIFGDPGDSLVFNRGDGRWAVKSTSEDGHPASIEGTCKRAPYTPTATVF